MNQEEINSVLEPQEQIVWQGIVNRKVNINYLDPIRTGLEYHVYDCFSLTTLGIFPYESRKVFIEQLFMDNKKIKTLPCIYVSHFDEAHKLTEQFIAEGYEGSIFRKKDGLYIPSTGPTGTRSSNIQKYKKGLFDEGKIIKIIKGDKRIGDIKILVEHPLTKKNFNIVGNGTIEYRNKIYESRTEYENIYNIRYTYFSNTNSNIPRSPVLVLSPDQQYVMIRINNTQQPTDKIQQIFTVPTLDEESESDEEIGEVIEEIVENDENDGENDGEDDGEDDE